MSTDVLSQILETARLLETQLKVYEMTIRNAKVVRDANKAKEKQLEKEVLSLRMVLKREQAATRILTKRCSKYNLPTADSSSWPVQFFNADPLPEFPDFCSMPLTPADTFANPIFHYQPEPYTDFMFLETGHDTYNSNEPVFSQPSLMDSHIPALHIPLLRSHSFRPSRPHKTAETFSSSCTMSTTMGNAVSTMKTSRHSFSRAKKSSSTQTVCRSRIHGITPAGARSVGRM